jgi:hypothetical protein
MRFTGSGFRLELRGICSSMRSSDRVSTHTSTPGSSSASVPWTASPQRESRSVR